MQKTKYKNDPISEVICEFKFSPDTQWDPSIAGFFYREVMADYPIKETRVGKNVEFVSEDSGIRQKINSVEYLACLNASRNQVVQITTRTLIINHLAPYTHWEAFFPVIQKVFHSLQSVTELKGIEKIGLRYINKIKIPEKAFELNKYFEYYPNLGNLPGCNHFMVGCMIPYNNNRDLARIQLTPANNQEPDTSIIILDIDFFLHLIDETVNVDNALSWVDDAHSTVCKIFEACIKDTLRALFNKER
ncbi:MAG: TIGR04255 family protein [Syntrophomonadaceae bacterium]